MLNQGERNKMSHNHSNATNTNNLHGEVVETVSQKIRKKRTLPKSVRPEEFKILIDKIPSKDFIAAISFLLAYGAGLRVSEVLRCKGEHFRFGTPGSIFVPESKYGVERIVPIPKGFKKEWQNKLPLKTTARTLERKFKMYCKNAGLTERYTFHSLRHGFATRLLESGTPINQVQVLLGHSNISTTSIYTKANPVDALSSYYERF